MKPPKLTLSGADATKFNQARVLARALKDITQAFTQMDCVFFNPSTQLDLETEVTEKIVSLLQSMEEGA
jgi:hypothetical protein